jgi:hypothetical protein
MNKFNQKNINRIVFQKLLESRNQIFQELLNEDDWWRDPQFNAPVPQERGIDPARGIIPSIDDVNPPQPKPKKVSAPPPTRKPKINPQKPAGLGENIGQEPGNPEEEWEIFFLRDNWYGTWKDSWERLYGKGVLVDQMNKEFEKMVEEMNRIYRKTRGPYGSGAPIEKSWQKSIEHFFKYFVQPTLA